MLLAGLLALLEVLQHLAAPDCEGAALLIAANRTSNTGNGVTASQQQQPGLLAALLGLLHERHTAALQAWPGYAGGGRDGVGRLVGALSELLAVPLSNPAGWWQPLGCGVVKA